MSFDKKICCISNFETIIDCSIGDKVRWIFLDDLQVGETNSSDADRSKAGDEMSEKFVDDDGFSIEGLHTDGN